MTQNDKDLLLKDLCARLPYGIKCEVIKYDSDGEMVFIRNGSGALELTVDNVKELATNNLYKIKPYLFPLSSMTEEDHTIYSKIWEDTGKTAYLEGCHHLISTIKAYKAANDYLLSKHYDINGLIPMGLANDATGLNIY